MSGALPTAAVVRRPGLRERDPQVWAVMNCPFCRRRHFHDADPELKSVILPAHCDKSRFYRLVEA